MESHKSIFRYGFSGFEKDKDGIIIFLRRIKNYCKEFSKSKDKPECGLTSELDFMSKYYRLFGFSELPSKKRRKKHGEEKQEDSL